MTYDQTHWIPAQRRQPLPTYYYHAHFVEMLEFVERHYAHVLRESDIEFITAFRALDRDAQCLYVRLVNRKGRVFARNKLRYPELGKLQPLLAELFGANWIALPDASFFNDVLSFLTRAEIYAVAQPLVPGMSRSLKKAELVEFVREHVAADRFMAALDTDRILLQQRTDEVRYLLFLFFGRIRDSLSQFTMRDLGLVRTVDAADHYEPRYGDRVEALEHYYFACRHKLADVASSAELVQMLDEAAKWPEPNFPGSARLRDELAYTLGRKAERSRAGELALSFYRKGESAQCSERIARLLIASGSRDEAKDFLERCIDNPKCDEELLFAQDLYERKFGEKRTSAATDALRAADVVEIDESKSGAPERAVLEHFAAAGVAAYRTENQLWRTLFGLLLWDELFVDGDGSAHSPFEFIPTTLSDGTFYSRNKSRIEDKLGLLHDAPRAKQQILRSSTRHYGTPNGVFRWRRELNDAVFALLDHADVNALTEILRALCRDYLTRRYGYPDLMLIDSEGVRFVEVKTEGDQLRRNQLLRLKQLRDAGFRAEVLRVRWMLDPRQDYVVVDVETTGGKGDKHRVTEIGAVKVRDGEVVDRFQTLLNPQRAIPAGIVRLTGITPAMVENAPYFIDVVDDFEAFLDGAIFVAHNVDFDYGFIAREFARVGRPFRHAKLCTCSAMRKLYPGHCSYSLAALCRQYDIPLKQHHRALCDAEAAAELLLLINEKRQAATTEPPHA